MNTTRYSHAKIYKITNDRGRFYIGSTVNSLTKRLGEHQSRYKKYLSGSGAWTSSFDVLGGRNIEITLIEEYPCNNKTELARREGTHIRNHPDSCNKNIAGRTNKEWREENRQHLKTYHRQWSIEKLDHLQTYRRNYYNNVTKPRRQAQAQN